MTKGKSSLPSDLSVFPKEQSRDQRRVTQDQVLGVVDPLLLMETPPPKHTEKGGVLDTILSADDARIDDIFDSLFFSEKAPATEEDPLRRKNTSIESAVQLAALEAAEVYGVKTTEHLAAPNDSSAYHASLPPLQVDASATPSSPENAQPSTLSDVDVVPPPSSGALQRLQHARTDGDLPTSPHPPAMQISAPSVPLDLSTVQFSAPLAQGGWVEPSALVPAESSEASSLSRLPTTQTTATSSTKPSFSAATPQKSPFHANTQDAAFPSHPSPVSPSNMPSQAPKNGATSQQDEPLNPHATRVGLSLGHLINPLELGVELVQLSEADLKGAFGEVAVPTPTAEDWAASGAVAHNRDDLHESFDDIARDPFDDASRESYDDIARDSWTASPAEEPPSAWENGINPLQTSVFRAAPEEGSLPAPVSIEHLLPDEPATSRSVEKRPNDPAHLFTAARFSETLPLARPTTPQGSVIEILEGSPVTEMTRPMQRPSTLEQGGAILRSPTPPPPSVPMKPVRPFTPPPPSAVGATLQDTPRASLGISALSVGATLQDVPHTSLASSSPAVGATLQDEPLSSLAKPTQKAHLSIPKEELQSGVLWSAVSSSSRAEDDHGPEETVLEAEVSTAMKGMSMELLQPKSPPAPVSLAATLPQQAESGLDKTWLSPHIAGASKTPSLSSAPQSETPAGNLRNTTILPKVRMTGKAHELINESRDRYEVVRKLGEGAVGEVSLAKDNDIQRLVAIKRLKEPTPQTGSLVRFVEEIQTNGQLEHPNIAPVHDVGIDADGRYFFVMKYVRGDNLEEIIEKLRNGDAEAHRVYTPHYRTQIALEILRAVQFAHEQGVIHRDLKPSNVIVGPHGEVMVMDWGIAKTVRAQQPTSPLVLPTQPVLFTGDILQKEERVFETSVGTLMGTPAYMSPEQALGLNDRIDQRSDIYSLCAMLYEFFSLQHYMGHKTDLKSMLMGIITEEPLRMDLVRNAHQSPPSRILSMLLHKGLAKEPGQRYASVQELSDAIQHDYLEGQNAVACSYSLTRRSGNELLRYLDRHPRLAPLLAMSVVLFALFGGAVAIFFLVRLL